jgi:hypothetical protein
MTNRIAKSGFVGLVLAGVLTLPVSATAIEIDFASSLSAGSDSPDGNAVRSKEIIAEAIGAQAPEAALQNGRSKKNTSVVEAYTTTIYRLILNGSSAVFNRAISYSQTPLVNGCTFCQKDVSSRELDPNSNQTGNDPFITLSDTRQFLAETGNQKAKALDGDGLLKLDGAKLLDRLDDVSLNGDVDSRSFVETLRGNPIYIFAGLLLLALLGSCLILIKRFAKRKSEEFNAPANG